RFILNKRIHPVVVARDQIESAINRHYGRAEQHAAEVLLSEFTDTQIEFSESQVLETDFDLPQLEDESASQLIPLEESDQDLETCDFDLALEDDASASRAERMACVDEMLYEEETDREAEQTPAAPAAAAPAEAAARSRSEPCEFQSNRSPLVQRHA